MEEEISKHPKPKPQKLVIILEGERPCFAAYADAAQEKKILDILNEHRHRLAN